MINSAVQTIAFRVRRMPWNELRWCRLRFAKRFFIDHCRLLIEGRENPRSGKKKSKGSFYIAQYPVRWTAQSALHFLPSSTDLFILTPFSASPGSILVMQQLRATTKSLTFPPLSIARYSCIQLSRQGCQWREEKCPIFETVAKGDSNPGSLDCESGILPLSYRAPQCDGHGSMRHILQAGMDTSSDVPVWGS